MNDQQNPISKTLFYAHKFFLIACIILSWRLNLETLTPGKGSALPDSQILFFYLFNRFSHGVLTNMRISSLVFGQGISHDDTLTGSNWDARVTPENICDICPTLVYTFLKHLERHFKCIWRAPCILFIKT